MYSKYLSLLACALLLVLGACHKASLEDSTKPAAHTAANSSAPAVATGDNSQNALDWVGTYYGTLPCADCEGIATRIRLGKDLRYQLSETYLGKSDTAVLAEGIFTWNADGNSISLQGITEGARSTQLQVGENKLTQLDLQGSKIVGDSAEKYVLVKQTE